MAGTQPSPEPGRTSAAKVELYLMAHLRFLRPPIDATQHLRFLTPIVELQDESPRALFTKECGLLRRLFESLCEDGLILTHVMARLCLSAFEELKVCVLYSTSTKRELERRLEDRGVPPVRRGSEDTVDLDTNLTPPAVLSALHTLAGLRAAVEVGWEAMNVEVGRLLAAGRTAPAQIGRTVNSTYHGAIFARGVVAVQCVLVEAPLEGLSWDRLHEVRWGADVPPAWTGLAAFWESRCAFLRAQPGKSRAELEAELEIELSRALTQRIVESSTGAAYPSPQLDDHRRADGSEPSSPSGAGAGQPAPPLSCSEKADAPPHRCVLDGEVWDLRFEGESGKFGPKKGFEYIRTILAGSPKPVEALELAGVDGRMSAVRYSDQPAVAKEDLGRLNDDLRETRRMIEEAREEDPTLVPILEQEKEGLLAAVREGTSRYASAKQGLAQKTPAQLAADGVRQAIARAYKSLDERGMTRLRLHLETFLTRIGTGFRYVPPPGGPGWEV